MKYSRKPHRVKNKFPVILDPILLVTVFCLLLFGLVMVSSSSFEISQKIYTSSFHYFLSQGMHIILGLILGALVFFIDLRILCKFATTILFLSLLLLIVVLIPGIGRSVNGSFRWIRLGFFNVQVSEIAKLGIIIYLSFYFVQYQDLMRSYWVGFIRPVSLVGLVCLLLFCEPDFGASFVIVAVSLSLLYLAGISVWWFTLLLIICLLAFGILMLSSPYRLSRLISFLDPWSKAFDSGYQLTQSLIAFGRGSWFGVGIGESIQKLFYLPEAHTDFIFAIIIEEFGLIGGFLVILAYTILFLRGMRIGHFAHKLDKHFNGFLAQGITLLIGFQVVVNIGVNTGLLPTKGLTLPLISYGGSSIIINCIAMALLMKVHVENYNY